MKSIRPNLALLLGLSATMQEQSKTYTMMPEHRQASRPTAHTPNSGVRQAQRNAKSAKNLRARSKK